MHAYQKEFIEFTLKHNALKFGEFKLKSGRISPYFFNSGVFQTGDALAQLGHYYAEAISSANLPYDMLFGPAYKGIPLVCSTAIALAKEKQKNVPYCFNRKESKDHGEGGNIVGAPLKGNVLIIDDVITAGTAVRESMQLIQSAHANLSGIVISLDRQERGQQNASAIQEIQQTYQTKVISIIQLHHILEFIKDKSPYQQFLPKVQAYKKEYGAIVDSATQ
jgi:orotate phosphoribosyltransferase